MGIQLDIIVIKWHGEYPFPNGFDTLVSYVKYNAYQESCNNIIASNCQSKDWRLTATTELRI